MSSSRKRLLGAVLVSVMTAVCACQNKYERLPQASASVFQALKERYLALVEEAKNCLLYTSPSPRDRQKSRMPSSA